MFAKEALLWCNYTYSVAGIGRFTILWLVHIRLWLIIIAFNVVLISGKPSPGMTVWVQYSPSQLTDISPVSDVFADSPNEKFMFVENTMVQ